MGSPSNHFSFFCVRIRVSCTANYPLTEGLFVRRIPPPPSYLFSHYYRTYVFDTRPRYCHRLLLITAAWISFVFIDVVICTLL